MKTTNRKLVKNRIVIINNLKYERSGGFLTLAGPMRNTIDNFHNYSRKQIV